MLAPICCGHPSPFFLFTVIFCCLKLFSLLGTKFLTLALLLLEAGWLGVG